MNDTNKEKLWSKRQQNIDESNVREHKRTPLIAFPLSSLNFFSSRISCWMICFRTNIWHINGNRSETVIITFFESKVRAWWNSKFCIFVWTMACHNYYVSDWKSGHLEEPIHSEFHPSQKESFWLWCKCETSETTWSVLEPYRELHEIFHSLSLRTILRSWAVEASNSYSPRKPSLRLKSAEFSSL